MYIALSFLLSFLPFPAAVDGATTVVEAPPPALEVYKGRTIAQTMHWKGAEWLLRKEREREESTQLMMENLGLQPGQTACDLGSGNGYHTLMMARKVGETGKVLAVDIQQEMLTMLEERATGQGIHNVETILGELHDPRLPENTLDLVLVVDAYHEFSHPEHMLRAVRKSLTPTGQLVLVEFRSEDPEVPIKPLHKMSKEQILKELLPNGFKLVREFDELPWQHMMFFERAPLSYAEEKEAQVLAGLPGVGYADSPQPTEPKPNFIIIFTDDQGYQDLGVFGSPNIKTPHIDRMAKEGRIFTSFYVSSPLCSASRAALLTGCYPKRLGMERAVFFPQDNTGIHPDEVTIADMLKPAGYATACIGKWHVGHRKPFLPTNQGFDSYYGIPYSNDMTHPDNRQRPPYGKWDVYWKDQAASVKQWHTPLMENEEIVEIPVDQRTITRRYTDRAIDFVSSNRDKPFFLYLAHSMPHVPLYVPDEVYAETNKAYEVTIEHIDAETGRLLDTVRDLGLDKNTYMIFTSDNGPWLKFKHHAGSAKPLSGGKGWFQEGGIRVPCVMWGPGRIPAGTKTDEMASTLDLFPTFARLAGVQPETRGPIDGLDITGLMMGTEASPRSELLYYSDQKLFGMRKGDWKILGRDLDKNPALYHLAEDLREQNNLAQTHPEKLAELKARAKELDAQVSTEMRSLGSYSPE